MSLTVEARLALFARYGTWARRGFVSGRLVGFSLGSQGHGLESGVSLGGRLSLRRSMSVGRTVWASYGRCAGRSDLPGH